MIRGCSARISRISTGRGGIYAAGRTMRGGRIYKRRPGKRGEVKVYRREVGKKSWRGRGREVAGRARLDLKIVLDNMVC